MKEFLEKLDAAVRKRAGSLRGLRSELDNLHAGFTGQRGRRAPGYLDTADSARAYLASFTLPNAARARLALDRMRGGLKKGESALDVGAGTGAAALALASRSDPDSRIVLLDTSPTVLQEATRLFGALFPRGPRVETRVADLSEGLPGESFECIMMGHVLNELLPRRGRGPGDALAAAKDAARRLPPSGKLLVLEPAQRVPSRALCQVRQALLGDGLTPLGPCTHAAGCPVIEDKGDAWCVTDVYWKRPPITRTVDQIVGIDRRRLTVSWLGLTRAAAPPTEKYEVLSRPMHAKKGWILYLCGKEGRIAAIMDTKPAPPPPRGSHVTLPKNARAEGRDRSGSPLVRIRAADLRP